VTPGEEPTWVSVGSLPGCRPWPGGLDYPEGSASVGGVSEGQSQGEPFSIVRGFVRVKHQEAREFFQGKRGRVGRQPSLTGFLLILCRQRGKARVRRPRRRGRRTQRSIAFPITSR